MTTETQPPASGAPARTLDTAEIQKILPHRYPFLLVDRVDITESGKKATGTKGVTSNEEFFQGHFPGHPIMPGVLILEALAQTACVLLMSQGGFENKIAYFLGIDGAKFRQPVRPGVLLKLNVEVLRAGSRAGKFRGEARVDGELAAEAEMTFAVVDK
ncbi:MAG: 3-hydroxyacyl-ACP dehydratase FabZ [Elusimicrobia bacterium]|nr:3-hydroxyacyl-ACP dehydratase FabZ [Elusimicrobiota bacterium]